MTWRRRAPSDSEQTHEKAIEPFQRPNEEPGSKEVIDLTGDDEEGVFWAGTREKVWSARSCYGGEGGGDNQHCDYAGDDSNGGHAVASASSHTSASGGSFHQHRGCDLEVSEGIGEREFS